MKLKTKMGLSRK